MSTTDNECDAERKGNRLSKIVTRTGDAGTTGLGDGSRTTKDSLRIDAMGEVDELNSGLGVLLCEDLPHSVQVALLDIQNDLFDLGGELCLPGMEVMKDVQVARLEALVEEFNANLPMLKEFILPGGTRAAARWKRSGNGASANMKLRLAANFGMATTVCCADSSV